MDEELQTQLDVLVRAAYLPRDEIIEALAEMAGDEDVQVDDDELAAAVDASFAALRAEAAGWPTITDNDRLDDAFARLDAAGIIARQDFACCTSCAQAEIWDEVSDPTAWRGNVWFHRQDTERAVVGDGLYLGFAGRDERSRLQRLLGGKGAERAAADSPSIGREIVKALADTGLTVDWNGKVERRILLEPFTWRRRRSS